MVKADLIKKIEDELKVKLQSYLFEPVTEETLDRMRATLKEYVVQTPRYSVKILLSEPDEMKFEITIKGEEEEVW